MVEALATNLSQRHGWKTFQSLQNFYNTLDNFTKNGQIEMQMANINIHAYLRTVSLIIQ